MQPAFLIITVLFFIGGVGLLMINRKLTPGEKKQNWIKYFTYLLIVIIVLGSILIDRKLFIVVIIIINSVGIIEMMLISKNSIPDHPGNNIFLVSLGIYSILLLFFFFFALLPETIVAYTYILVFVFDGASQIIGQLGGKNRLAPGISPNKTWEGFIGGSIIAVITSILLHKSGSFTILKSLIFGAIICFSSLSGDLLASRFKRIFRVKDFSNMLPGQGGMFDRFDSFISSGAMIGLLGIPYLIINHIDKDVAAYLAITFIFLAILLAGEYMHYSFRLKPEYARMLSHFIAGIISLFFLQKFSSPYYILALCIQSAAFLIATDKMGFLESHHKVKRKTSGSSLFFLGVLIAYFISFWTGQKAYFTLPILILTICDPLAAFTGLNCKSKHWTSILTSERSPKTYIGSFAFFVSSSILLFISLQFFYEINLISKIIISFSIGMIVSVVEAISSDGLDNLAIPGSVIVLMFVMDKIII